MGSVISSLLKYIPIALKWIVQVGPLAYEAAKWTVKVIKELKKKPPPETGGARPVDKKLDPG